MRRPKDSEGTSICTMYNMEQHLKLCLRDLYSLIGVHGQMHPNQAKLCNYVDPLIFTIWLPHSYITPPIL